MWLIVHIQYSAILDRRPSLDSQKFKIVLNKRVCIFSFVLNRERGVVLNTVGILGHFFVLNRVRAVIPLDDIPVPYQEIYDG